MNSNTVAGFIGGTGVNQIKSQTLITTTETEFVLNTGATPATTIAVVSVPLTTDIRGVATQFDPAANPASTVRTGNRFGNQYFNANNVDAILSGGPFLVRLMGIITPISDVDSTINLIIYNGTTKSGTAIATTGAQAGIASSVQTGSFILETQLTWDSTSGKLGGQQWYQFLGGATAFYNTWKVNAATATGITAATLQFCASATWGDAPEGGTIQVSEFSISRL